MAPAECGMMLRRLLARVFYRSVEMRRDASALIALHGIDDAWVVARDRRRAARLEARWSDDPGPRACVRHWDRVIQEIERQASSVPEPEASAERIEVGDRPGSAREPKRGELA